MLSRTCLVTLSLLLPAAASAAGDPPPAPPVSAFAPSDDLTALVERYAALCEKHLADPAQWEVNQPLVKKDGATLAVAALAAGLDETDTRHKSAAAGIYRAAQRLAQAGDHAAAAEALAEIKARQSSAEGDPLDWNRKHASMGQLMKQVTFVYNRLKRGARPDRLARQKDECCLDATLLAVIAQAVTADTHEVKDPAQTAEWYALCAEMRDRAAEVRIEAAKGDAAATATALERLDLTCTKCHQVFRPDQL